MSEEYHFLLIGVSPDDLWRQVIEEALTSLGGLQIIGEEDVFKLIQWQDYDLIVIDAVKVEDAFLLTSSIRSQHPDAKVVIATASPTWMRAREAFRVGAIDYTRKSMNIEETRSMLRATLVKAPPSRRR